MKQKDKDGKVRFTFWINPEVMEVVKASYKNDNCTTINEYIEKAVMEYNGKVHYKNHENFISKILISTLQGMFNEKENRQNTSLFKIAVELSMIKNILAIREGISDIALDKLKSDCMREVRKINGAISYKDAIEWQS